MIEQQVAAGVSVEAIREALLGQGVSVCTKTIRRALKKPRAAVTGPASATRSAAPGSAVGAAPKVVGAGAAGAAPGAPGRAASAPVAPAAPAANRLKTFEWPPKVDRANRWKRQDASAADESTPPPPLPGEEKK